MRLPRRWEESLVSGAHLLCTNAQERLLKLNGCSQKKCWDKKNGKNWASPLFPFSHCYMVQFSEQVWPWLTRKLLFLNYFTSQCNGMSGSCVSHSRTYSFKRKKKRNTFYKYVICFLNYKHVTPLNISVLKLVPLWCRYGIPQIISHIFKNWLNVYITLT